MGAAHQDEPEAALGVGLRRQTPAPDSNLQLHQRHCFRPAAYPLRLLTVHICYSDHVHVDGVTIRNNEGGRGQAPMASTSIRQRRAGRTRRHLRQRRCALPESGPRLRWPAGCAPRRGHRRTRLHGATAQRLSPLAARPPEVFATLRSTTFMPLGTCRWVCCSSPPTRAAAGRQHPHPRLQLENVPIPVQITMNWNPHFNAVEIPRDSRTFRRITNFGHAGTSGAGPGALSQRLPIQHQGHRREDCFRCERHAAESAGGFSLRQPDIDAQSQAKSRMPKTGRSPA